MQIFRIAMFFIHYGVMVANVGAFMLACSAGDSAEQTRHLAFLAVWMLWDRLYLRSREELENAGRPFKSRILV